MSNTDVTTRVANLDDSHSTVQQQNQFQHPRSQYLMVIISAFLINFTACGILFSFGVFQAHYEALAGEQNTPFTGATPAQIGLIGTLSAALMTIFAPFVLTFSNRNNPQTVVFVGGVLFGMTNVLTSFGTTLWHFQICQGLVLGIATGLSFTPSMVVPPPWFDKHRALVMGIISAGTGAGGLVFAPTISASINALGFRNTLRLFGCLATILICGSSIGLKRAPSNAANLQSQRQQGAWFHQVPMPGKYIVRQRKFIAQLTSIMFQSAVYYTPVFFTVAYAQTLGFSETDSANIIAAGNACNALGKILIGVVADRIGRLNCIFLATLVSGISSIALWLVSALIANTYESAAKGLFVVFTVLYGLFASAYISLLPTVLVELFGLDQLPGIAGVAYMSQGLSVLVGVPVSGLLLGEEGHSGDPSKYVGMAAFVGVLMCVASAGSGWARLELRRERNTTADGSRI